MADANKSLGICVHSTAVDMLPPLIVHKVAPERITKISSCHLHFFGSSRTISGFGEHFRDGQYSLVSFLFAVILLTVPSPPCSAICKSGGTCPVPYGIGATTYTKSIHNCYAATPSMHRLSQ